MIAIVAAASSTATEPMASLTTSRKAARMFMSCVRVRTSRAMDAPLPTRPTRPNTIIAVDATSGGSTRRRTASTMTKQPTASRTAACPAAASTSARRKPHVRAGGRTAGQDGGAERKAETEDVGQHVTGVGQQREAAGHDRTDHLDDEDGRGDAEHGRQPAR